MAKKLSSKRSHNSNRRAIRKNSLLRRYAVLIVGLIMLIGIAVIFVSQAGTSNLKLQSVREIGTLSKPANVLSRDGGASALIGGKVVWLFADTIYTAGGLEKQPENWRSSTMATADLSRPFRLEENIDASGVPIQFIPYTAEEIAYNQASNDIGGNRIALWPTSIVSTGENTGLVYYTKYIVRGELNYEFQSAGVAEYRLGDKTAIRKNDALFSDKSNSFTYAVADETYVYVYGCNREKACKVSRSPVATATESASYRGWDGTTWGSLSSGKQIFEGSSVGLSVAWNPYLLKYTVTYMMPFTNKISLRYADSPQGPWSEVVDLVNTKLTDSISDGTATSPTETATVDTQFKFGQPESARMYTYASRQHPEISPINKNSIYMTYYTPANNFNGKFSLLLADYSNSELPAIQPKNIRVMPIGDSMTVGYPAYQGGYRTWLWRFAKGSKLDIDFVGPFQNGPEGFLGDLQHAGIAGITTEGYLAYLKEKRIVATERPQYALLMLGTNDMSDREGIKQPSYAELASIRMKLVIEEIYRQSPKTKQIVSTIPPRYNNSTINERIKSYNSQLQTLVKELKSGGMPVSIVNGGDEMLPINMGSFGVHPTVSGNTKLANIWLSGLLAQ